MTLMLGRPAGTTRFRAFGPRRIEDIAGRYGPGAADAVVRVHQGFAEFGARPHTLREKPMDMTDVRAIVTEVTAEVLGVDSAALYASPTLTALPTFNSFRIVEIVERVEEQLDVEVEPAELTPDNLTRLDTLTALFERTASRSGMPG
jgi:acyl carrier protein